MTNADEPFYFLAGMLIPKFTAEDFRLMGIPENTVLTAGALNAGLDRLRAQDPDGKLPTSIQQKIDSLPQG